MPEAKKMEAWISFKLGNYQHGWPPYPGATGYPKDPANQAGSFKNPSTQLRKFGFSEWQTGSKPKGKTLIWLDFDSSIGGEVLCLTLFGELQRRYPIESVLVVDSRMVGFAQRCFPDVTVLPKQSDFSQYVGIGDSYILGRRLMRILISSDEDFVSIRRNPIAKKAKLTTKKAGPSIGISWKTTNLNQGRYRNVPLKLLIKSLLGFPWSRVVVLQHAATPSELKTLRRAFGERLAIANPSDTIEKFADDVGNLDYVITIDNTVLYLAASLGVSTFALLSTPSYWTWPVGGQFSRWFDSVHLIHQTKPRNWRQPLHELRRKLAQIEPNSERPQTG
jgi:hypothetical protein